MVLRKSGASAMLALALMALAGIFLVPRLNEATGRVVSEGIGYIRDRLEAALGLSVSFDSLSPSILRSASFSRLSISAPGGRTLLSAGRVRVLYDILALLRGKKSEALTGLELEDVNLDIRLPEDKPILDRLGLLFAGGAEGGSFPKIVISGKNVSATLAVAGQGKASLNAREVSFSTVKEEPAVYLEGLFSLEPALGGLGRISGPLSLSGSLSSDFRRARLGLSIAATSRDFALSTQRFELLYGEGRLALTKVKDRAPLDADILVDFKGGDSSMTLMLDGYSPSRSLSLSGRYASLEPWLEIPYSGSIALKAPGFDLSRLAYDLRLSGSLPAGLLLSGRPAVQAEIVARGDARSIAIDRARVELGSDSLEYSGTLRFGDLSPDGVLDLRLSLMGGKLDIASSLRILGQGGEYAVLADKATIGKVVFSDLALAAARKGSVVDFNVSFRPPTQEDRKSVV
jgi:hypothetical protein